MVTCIDINCDLGEGIPNEAAIMPFISSCNIACGGHTGDDQSMAETIALALNNKVKIGAHPSFPDSENFGRAIMHLPSKKLQQSIEDQLNALQNNLKLNQGTLHHVKAHGALYNQAAHDGQAAMPLINAVRNTCPEAFLYLPYGSKFIQAAKEMGIKVKVEAFADRNYHKDLTLVSRSNKHAVLIEKEKVLDHLLLMIKNNRLKTHDGAEVPMHAETYCIHGDNLQALEILKFLSKELPKNDVKIT